MGMKHKIKINVANEGDKKEVLKGADRLMPWRLLKWIFGDYSQVYLLKPGESVESVEVHEVKEDEEDENEQ